MGYELARALLLAEIVTPQALERALFASLSRGMPLSRALVETGAVDAPTLDDTLSRVDAPAVRTVLPMMDLMALLPPGLCARLLAVPIRRDPTTGTVDVAVADARDTHAQQELEHHLNARVRLVRASLAAIEEGLHRKTRTMPPAASVRGTGLPAAFGAPRPPGLPSPLDAPPRSQPPSYYPGGAIIPAVVPERRHIPPVSAAAGPAMTREPARVASMTPPWGTAVPSVNVPAQAGPHAAPPLARQSAQSPDSSFASNEGGTLEYGAVPSPAETRPGVPVPPNAQAPRPPHLSQAPHTERTPAVERPIPLTRMSINAPRERVQTLYYERHPTTLPHQISEAEPLPSFIPGPPPRTVRGHNPQAGFPFADGSSVIAALRASDDRDQVLEYLLTGARAVARKVAIFVVKRGGLVGWTCSPEFGDRTQLQAIMMSLTTPSIFTTAMNEGLYLGAVRHDDVHAPLLRVMGGASRDVAVAPVRVLGKAAVVVLADELGDTMIATRRLEELARTAGEAFARIMKAKR